MTTTCRSGPESRRATAKPTAPAPIMTTSTSSMILLQPRAWALPHTARGAVEYLESLASPNRDHPAASAGAVVDGIGQVKAHHVAGLRTGGGKTQAEAHVGLKILPGNALSFRRHPARVEECRAAEAQQMEIFAREKEPVLEIHKH